MFVRGNRDGGRGSNQLRLWFISMQYEQHHQREFGVV